MACTEVCISHGTGLSNSLYSIFFPILPLSHLDSGTKLTQWQEGEADIPVFLGWRGVEEGQSGWLLFWGHRD